MFISNDGFEKNKKNRSKFWNNNPDTLRVRKNKIAILIDLPSLGQ